MSHFHAVVWIDHETAQVLGFDAVATGHHARIEQRGNTVGVLQVERHVAPTAQHHVEVRGLGGGSTNALCTLDADDLGPHVGEQHRRERAGPDAGDLDDAIPSERSRHGRSSS